MKYCSIVIIFLCIAEQANAKEIVVEPNGKVSSLQEAVRLADSGDVVRVRGGEFHLKEFTIEKTISLIGENFPVLDGDGRNEILVIKAKHVLIEGFLFRNAGVNYLYENAAVRVVNTSHCTIRNNRFYANFFAIYLSKSHDCKIQHNFIEATADRESNSGNGIHLWYSNRAVISDNEIIGHRDGIYFEFVEGSLIERNRSERNLRYGLHFMFSHRCKYRNNVFRKNSAGVAVMYTKDVEMTNNLFELNWGEASYGLLLKDISRSVIERNEFVENTVAILAEGCEKTRIADNDFRRNGWALRIMGNSIENVITRNNFLENLFDVATNTSQNQNQFDGNFWSAYQGYDLNRDGFGDVPYRPVRLFSYIVEKQSAALVLLRSALIDVLEAAERVFPLLTPKTLTDNRPAMRLIKRETHSVPPKLTQQHKEYAAE